MGKADDMRRQREAQLAAAAGEPVAPDAEAPVDDTSGKCSVCGKTLALQRGLVGSHQKGLGKFCPGSRKPPA